MTWQPFFCILVNFHHSDRSADHQELNAIQKRAFHFLTSDCCAKNVTMWKQMLQIRFIFFRKMLHFAGHGFMVHLSRALKSLASEFSVAVLVRFCYSFVICMSSIGIPILQQKCGRSTFGNTFINICTIN